MNNYTNDYIEDYLAGRLEQSEKQAFEAAMQQDAALREEVETHAELLAAIKTKGQEILKNKITELSAELDQTGFFITDEELEAYIEESLPVAEQIKITKQALINPELKQRIENHRILLKSIDQKGKESLKMQISLLSETLEKEGFFDTAAQTTVSTEQKSKDKPKKKTAQALYYAIFAAAAVVALILTVTFVELPIGNKKIPYQAYFSPLDDKLSTVINNELSEKGFGGETKTSLEKLKMGMSAYQQKDYAQTVLLLNEYLKSEPSADFIPRTQLYLSIAYLAQKEAEKAISLLSGLQTNVLPSEQKVDAEWYLALAYSQTNKKEAAKNLLQKLVSNEKYNKKATALLMELN